MSKLRRSTDCADHVVRVWNEKNEVVATFELSDEGYSRADEMVLAAEQSRDAALEGKPASFPESTIELPGTDS
jgi:hypothetical protein